MLAFSMLVAGSFSFGGRIANDIDPLALTALRLLLGALVVGALAASLGQFSWRAFRAPWRYLLLGALFGAYFVLMFEGLKTAHPVSIAAVFTLTPLLAAGFGWAIMGQSATARMGLGLTLGAMGALWVIFRGSVSDFLAFRIGTGELIFFFGCIAHALYAPLVPKLNRGEPVLMVSCGMMFAGALLVGLLGAREIAATAWSALSLQVWATLAYLVIFASAASVTLLQFASFRLKAAKVMAYTYLVPTWVVLWELALSGAVPQLVLLIGVGLTIVALLVLLFEGQAAPGASNS